MARAVATDGHFDVPDWFVDSAGEHGLTLGECHLFVVMCSSCGTKREVTLSQCALAELSRLSRSTVQRGLRKLLRCDFISVAVHGRPTIYRVHLSRPLPPQRLPAPTRRARMHGNGWLESV